MKTLITGANRGLGLEFARQCLDRGDTVIGCCRRPDDATDLKALGGDLHVVQLDVADEASVRSLPDRVDGELDLVINNAGIYGDEVQSVPNASAEQMAEIYHVNVIGPLLMMQTLADRISKGGRVANVSSGYGSITRAAGDWPVHYCCSKAALNMLTKIAGANIDATVVALNPGWVQTDMGGSNATLQPAESVGGMLKVITGLSLADSGSFRRYDGSVEPW